MGVWEYGSPRVREHESTRARWWRHLLATSSSGLLRDSRHSGFPVVQADGSRVFVGFISREKLEMLLARQAELQAKAEAEHRGAEHRGASARGATTAAAASPCPPSPRRRRNSLPGRLDTSPGRPAGLERLQGRGLPAGLNGDSSAEPSMRGGSAWNGSFRGRKRDGTATPSEAGAPETARRRRGSSKEHMGITAWEKHRALTAAVVRLRRPSSDAAPTRAGHHAVSELLSRGRHGLHAADAAKPAAKRPYSRPTIDLLPYCDRAPFTVNHLLPLYMVTRLFTSMGLRHLCVLDGRSRVCGVITRKDFAKSHSRGAALQDLSSYAHLTEGGIVQKRMLEASCQVERVMAQAEAHGHERPRLTRVLSEPSILQLAAARVAAERAENGSFKRHRAHSIQVNKRMATLLRHHPCFSGDGAAGGSIEQPADPDPDAGTK